MPVFVLYVKMELENVASVSIVPTTHFCLDVKEGAGSEERNGVYVSISEQHELTGSKGTANLVMKFAKGSKKESSINVQEIKGFTRAYTADDDRKWVPIMAFECRGLDPIAFHPEGDWTVQSSGGTKWQDVDLKEKEWTEFCEKGNESVGIYNFESKIELRKG